MFLLAVILKSADYDNNGVTSLRYAADVITQSSANVPVSGFINPGSVFNNPAAGFQAENPYVSFSYFNHLENAKIENFRFAYPFKENFISLQLYNFSIPGFEKRDVPGEALYEFEPQSWLLSFAYSYKLQNNIFLGLSYKYVLEDIDIYRYQTSTFDLGYFHKNLFTNGLELSSSVKNLGTDHHDGKTTAIKDIEIPLSLSNSLVYRFPLKTYNIQLSSGFTSEYFIETKEHELSSALATSFKEQIEVRVGLKFNNDGNPFTAGLGYKWNSLSFNYSYAHYTNDLGDVHGLNLIYSFDRIDL